MAQYKPYDNKRKFPRTFEKSQSNLSEIENKNIKKLKVYFRSENHYKPVTIIPIVSDYLTDLTPTQVSIDLIDFPDWAINMVQPNVTFYVDSAYNLQNDTGGFSDLAQEGTLKTGDIWINKFETFHWFTKQDSFYRFNFRFDVRVLVAQVSVLPSWSSIDIPVFANLSLYIINERNYNEVQSGK